MKSQRFHPRFCLMLIIMLMLRMSCIHFIISQMNTFILYTSYQLCCDYYVPLYEHGFLPHANLRDNGSEQKVIKYLSRRERMVTYLGAGAGSCPRCNCNQAGNEGSAYFDGDNL